MSSRPRERIAGIRPAVRRAAARSYGLTRDRDRVLDVALGVLAAALLLAVAKEAPDLVESMGLNSDLSAPVAMGELAHRYQDAQLVTGRLGWWEGLWFLQAIERLPASATIGLWLPLLVTLAVSGGLAWQARRVWGNTAGLLLALVALSVSFNVWIYDSSWSGRAPTWWAMAALGLVVVAGASGVVRASPVRTALLAAAGVLAAVHAGLALSGDSLAIPAVLVPLAAAALILATERCWSAAAFVVALGALVVISSELAKHVASSHGYLRATYPVFFLSPGALFSGLGNTLDGVAQLWRGPVAFGSEVRPMAALGVLGALAGVALVIAAIAAGSRDVLTRRTPNPEHQVWLAYWLAAAIGMLAIFWLTNVSSSQSGAVARYLYGLPVATAALIAALTRGRRLVVVVLVSTTALAALAAFVRHPPNPEIPPELSAVVRIAEAEGISRGYAGYWTAYPLSYAADYKLEVTPVGQCTAQKELRLCTMYLHYIDRAYVPRDERTFLVADRRPGIADHLPAAVTGLPDNVQQPVATHELSPEVTMYVFSYDIAADLAGNVGQGDPRAGKGGPLPPAVGG